MQEFAKSARRPHSHALARFGLHCVLAVLASFARGTAALPLLTAFVTETPRLLPYRAPRVSMVEFVRCTDVCKRASQRTQRCAVRGAPRGGTTGVLPGEESRDRGRRQKRCAEGRRRGARHDLRGATNARASNAITRKHSQACACARTHMNARAHLSPVRQHGVFLVRLGLVVEIVLAVVVSLALAANRNALRRARQSVQERVYKRECTRESVQESVSKRVCPRESVQESVSKRE